MKSNLKLFFLAGSMTLGCLRAPAQSYSIDWHAVASGGALKTAGIYSLTASIGQPEAGTSMTGGIFSLSGGFESLSTGVTNPPGPGLSVTPSSALTSIGGTGGPFSPPSQNYVLSNVGTNSLNWFASTSANWLGALPASGTLAPGSNVTVTVSINANANVLPGGTYSESASFINTTTGAGNTSRQVNLTVYTGLNVSGFGLDAIGPVGGPFTPVSTDYLLGNLGTSSMDWSATNESGWVTLSQEFGTLQGHASITVNVSLNSTANTLPAGEYYDIVYFTNTTDGIGSQFRFVSLTVTNTPTPGISVQPTHYTVSPGASATFTVGASGEEPLHYQWQHGGSDLPGATASSLKLSNIQAPQSGHYFAIVSNSWGSVTSAFGTLALLTFDRPGPPTMTLTATVGDRYRVEFVDHVDTNTWSLLGLVTLTNNPVSVRDTNLSGSRVRFYRAKYLP